MHELGGTERPSTRVALMVAMVRARALCLTPDFEAWKPFSPVSSFKGTSWLLDAELVLSGFTFSSDFLACEPALSFLRAAGRKRPSRLKGSRRKTRTPKVRAQVVPGTSQILVSGALQALSPHPQCAAPGYDNAQPSRVEQESVVLLPYVDAGTPDERLSVYHPCQQS